VIALSVSDGLDTQAAAAATTLVQRENKPDLVLAVAIECGVIFGHDMPHRAALVAMSFSLNSVRTKTRLRSSVLELAKAFPSIDPGIEADRLDLGNSRLLSLSSYRQNHINAAKARCIRTRDLLRHWRVTSASFARSLATFVVIFDLVLAVYSERMNRAPAAKIRSVSRSTSPTTRHFPRQTITSPSIFGFVWNSLGFV